MTTMLGCGCVKYGDERADSPCGEHELLYFALRSYDRRLRREHADKLQWMAATFVWCAGALLAAFALWRAWP